MGSMTLDKWWGYWGAGGEWGGMDLGEIFAVLPGSEPV